MDVRETVDRPKLMICTASLRPGARMKAAQLAGSLACLTAAVNAHCQQLMGQQDACPVVGIRLVLGIEAGSRDGDSGGDLWAAAATMLKAAIMRSMIRAKL